MSELSLAARREAVFRRAQGFCEYCRSHEENTGQAMHVEHIIPGGGDSLENLCLACSNCNLHKALATQAFDAVTGENAALFNPRHQIWRDHFSWSDGGISVEGKTPTGRATIERLAMNMERMKRARRNWMLAGNHPPVD